jgi:hypothetical protein
MRLVLIHGRSQGDKSEDKLREAWLAALAVGLEAAGLEPLDSSVEVRVPFYGKLLDDLTETPAPTGDIVSRGEDGNADRFEGAFVLELAERAGVTDEEIRAELGEPVQDRGPQNWPWVLAAGRALSKRAPWLGSQLLRLITSDVNAYLTRLDVREAVNEIVVPHLIGEPAVVIGHSLGSIVAYVNLIERERDAHATLLATVGSPLGIDVVKANLPRPLRKPGSVARWFNAADERDPVALFPRLDRDSFPAEIENLSDVHNPEDNPHGIAGYLADKTVAKKISEALRTS